MKDLQSEVSFLKEEAFSSLEGIRTETFFLV